MNHIALLSNSKQDAFQYLKEKHSGSITINIAEAYGRIRNTKYHIITKPEDAMGKRFSSYETIPNYEGDVEFIKTKID